MKSSLTLKPRELEFDEFYWFIGKKETAKIRENVYLITMIGRNPRQIVGFDVVYYGKHIRNIHDKSDTHNVESINADLRYYIPIFARKIKCFARKLETLKSVLEVFVYAYNRFGMAKYNYRQYHESGEISFSVIDSF